MKRTALKRKTPLKSKTPLKAKKGLSRGGALKAKSKKYQKATVPEAKLQNHADQEILKLGYEHNHIPPIVLQFLNSKSLRCDEEIKEFFRKFLYGRPDNEIVKRLDGTPYNLCLYMEIKTDSEDSKLNANQRRKLKGMNFAVPRSYDEITNFVQDFHKFEL